MEYIFYKIINKNDENNFIYVGSTKNLTKRRWNHKSTCDNPNSKSYNLKVYKTIRENGGFDNWDLIPIGKGIFESKIDARIEEQRYISDLKANLNSVRAIMTKEQEKEIKDNYIANNHQKVLDTKKKYRDSHKEELKEKYMKNTELKNKRKEKFICECGGSYTYSHKAEHEKSSKHVNFCK